MKRKIKRNIMEHVLFYSILMFVNICQKANVVKFVFKYMKIKSTKKLADISHRTNSNKNSVESIFCKVLNFL